MLTNYIYIYLKRKDMNININHPTFVSLIDKISINVLSTVNVENYFSQPTESKLTISYNVFNQIRTLPSTKIMATDSELKNFVTILWKRNEEKENYELASILSDILKNFDIINEFTTSKSKSANKRTKKIDK